MKHMFEVESAGSVMDDLQAFEDNIPNFVEFIKVCQLQDPCWAS